MSVSSDMSLRQTQQLVPMAPAALRESLIEDLFERSVAQPTIPSKKGILIEPISHFQKVLSSCEVSNAIKGALDRLSEPCQKQIHARLEEGRGWHEYDRDKLYFFPLVTAVEIETEEGGGDLAELQHALDLEKVPSYLIEAFGRLPKYFQRSVLQSLPEGQNLAEVSLKQFSVLVQSAGTCRPRVCFEEKVLQAVCVKTEEVPAWYYYEWPHLADGISSVIKTMREAHPLVVNELTPSTRAIRPREVRRLQSARCILKEWVATHTWQSIYAQPMDPCMRARVQMLAAVTVPEFLEELNAVLGECDSEEKIMRYALQNAQVYATNCKEWGVNPSEKAFLRDAIRELKIWLSQEKQSEEEKKLHKLILQHLPDLEFALQISAARDLFQDMSFKSLDLELLEEEEEIERRRSQIPQYKVCLDTMMEAMDSEKEEVKALRLEIDRFYDNWQITTIRELFQEMQSKCLDLEFSIEEEELEQLQSQISICRGRLDAMMEAMDPKRKDIKALRSEIDRFYASHFD